MVLDELGEFADSTAVAGAAATRNVGDVIDLGVARNIGVGKPSAYLYVLVETAPTGATSVEFRLVSDAVAPPATDGSATVHWTTGAVAIADLPTGTMFQIPLPAGIDYERYLGLQAVNVGATALADLVVSAGLTLDPKYQHYYPEGAN